MITSIGGIAVRNTRDIISPDTKLAMLIWSAAGKGKTEFCGGLNEMTEKFFGKPSLYIAIESGEGGGAATIRDKDFPLVTPQNEEELDKILAGLETDTTFGGVVLDSSTEMVKSFVKPTALKFPCRERGTGQMEVRKVGIPTRSDYQTMGEITRQKFQRILNLSCHKNPAVRKHVLVTATDRMNEDDDGKIIFWGPDLPGAMATTATAMFQITGTIDIRPTIVAGKRINTRYLITSGDGVKALKDRFKVFPQEVKLKNTQVNDPSDDGLNLAQIWERFWLPAIGQREEVKAVA